MRDISLHMMDIMQNSISAGATKITVSVNADTEKDELILEISDNGAGMDEEMLSKAADPFVTTRTTRKVGLGISLLQSSALRASGNLKIGSVKGKGTTLSASFKIGHIDRLPIGDIAETVASVIAAHPEIEQELNLVSSRACFKADTMEIKGKLGEVPIDDFEVLAWIREYINEGIKICFGGVLDEVDS